MSPYYKFQYDSSNNINGDYSRSRRPFEARQKVIQSWTASTKEQMEKRNTWGCQKKVTGEPKGNKSLTALSTTSQRERASCFQGLGCKLLLESNKFPWQRTQVTVDKVPSGPSILPTSQPLMTGTPSDPIPGQD